MAKKRKKSTAQLDAEARQKAAILWLRCQAQAKESHRDADLALEALLGLGAKPGDCFRDADGRVVVLVDHFATKVKQFRAAAFCRYTLEHVT